MDAIIYLFTFITEAYIFYLYTSKLFIMKHSRTSTILCIALGYLVMFLLSFFHNPDVNITIFTVIVFLLILRLFSARISQALFHTLILSSTMSLSEVIVTDFLFKYISTIWNEWVNWSHTFVLIIGVFFSKLLYLFITQFLAAIQKKNKSQHTSLNLGTVLLIIISICSFASINILCELVWNLPYSTTLEHTIAVGSTLMFIILILVYSLYGYNQKKRGEFTDLQLQLQKEKDAGKYYHMLAAQDEQQKIMIHDIKNHLQSLAQLNQDGRQKEVEQYLNELLQSDSLRPSVRVCDHELLNAILCRYQIQCQEKNIGFHTDIRSGCADFLTDEEITALFCNLLDNAIEAIGDTADSFIEVSMAKRPNPPVTTLIVKNSCPNAPKSGNAGQLLTSKSNPQYHGYGLRSVKRIATKYHGYMQAYYDEMDATFHVIVSFDTREMSYP